MWASCSAASPLIGCLAPAALALVGLACGRVGYDARVDVAADAAADAATADAPVDRPDIDGATADAIPSDSPPVDRFPPDVTGEAGAEVARDTPGEVSAAPPDGTLSCLPAPDPGDRIADFENGSAATVRFDDRGGTNFLLVSSGAGDIAVSPPRAVPLCGSSRFMTLQGTNIPADRQGHIQAHLMRSLPGQPTPYFDARAYTGVRLSLRASQALPVTLQVPDRNTVSTQARPYDHFRITLNATTEWRTYVVPFRDLRQAGNGMRFPGIDAQNLFAVEIAAVGATSFDLSIDDISFVR